MTARRSYSARVLELDPGRAVPAPPPRPVLKRPTCPTWMPAEGRREWRRIVPELETIGLAAPAYRATIVGYCAAWARWVEAEKLITKNGVLVEGYRGSLVKNPAVQIARDSRASMLVFARELGLTPRSIESISFPLPDEVDDDQDDGFFGEGA